MNPLNSTLHDSAIYVHHDASWRLTPANRDELVKLHQAGEQLVREDVSRDVYLNAIDSYLRYLVHIHIFPTKDREVLLRVLTVNNDQATAKAILYRINCQTLRFLSELCECTQSCCCNCMANYPGIACTSLEKMMLSLHEFDNYVNCEDCNYCSTDPNDPEGDGSGMAN